MNVIADFSQAFSSSIISTLLVIVIAITTIVFVLIRLISNAIRKTKKK